jgi:hypothetical protein
MSKLFKIGPLTADHAFVGGARPLVCRACQEPFRLGDYAAQVTLGPGADAEARALARAGKEYNGISEVVHWACATGEES